MIAKGTDTVHYRYGVVTDPGRVRDHNEDSYIVRPPMFGVADGLGGHAAGEIASQLAIQSMDSSGLDAAASNDDVRAALVEANRVVYEAGHEQGATKGMGTTFVVLVLGAGVARVGYVGDSRIYRLRNGTIEQLTRDHTLISDMVQQGLIDAETALRDDGHGDLMRALGGAQTVEADVVSVDTQPGDRFLLCSDGLWSMVRDDDLAALVGAGDDPQAAADQLVQAANAAGGQDNITALVVHVEGRARRTGSNRRALVIAVLVILVLAATVAVWLALRASSASVP